MTEHYENTNEYYWAVNPSLGLIYGELQKATIQGYVPRFILLPELSREKAGHVRYALNNQLFKTKEEAAAYGISYYRAQEADGMKFVAAQRNRVEFINKQLSECHILQSDENF